MVDITATFSVAFDSPVLCVEMVPNIRRPIPLAEARVDTTYRRFRVQVEFTNFGEQGHGRIGGPMARELTALSIAVTGAESELPVIAADEAQRRAYVVRRQQEYSIAAEAILARFITYFRFRLGNPLIKPYTHGLQTGMLNPRWTDADGRVIWDRVMSYSGVMAPGLRLFPKCGMKAYQPSDRSCLLSALENDTPVSFRDELLAEARDAIALGQLRRAILELAIACEVGVKQFYFQPETRADAAYSYLEDKGRSNTRVLEFLDGIALRAFGRSLRADLPECYRSIDWLFRCRNKVAHRGTPTFRDDAGNEFTASIDHTCEWWRAVSEVFEWLDNLISR